MIRFESVTLEYGANRLFSELDFEIPPGAKAALTGPSGSGKTSALELVPGFRRPVAGRVIVDRTPVTPANRQRIRAGLAYLPQETPLSGGVREAVMGIFQLRNNANRRPPEKAVRELFERVLLPGDALERSFADLSGGEKRRVGLVTVLLLDRPLLLLDEPTAGLDEAAARAVRELVFALPATVLSIAHDPAWHDDCDRLIELRPKLAGRETGDDGQGLEKGA